MNRIPRTVLTAAAFVLLAACGNKGPLYLPPPSEPIDPSTVPAEQPPADADSTAPAAEPAQPKEEGDTEKPVDPPAEVPASDANG